MHLSSSRSDTPTIAQEIPSAIQPPVVLSERSLILLVLVRVFVGLLWFQQLAWKMPPTFGGLRRYVESEAQHTFLPGYSFILNNVFLAHFSLLGAGVWTAELLVGITLLFGLFTRFGALLALLLSVQLYVGLAYAPGEWYWTYGMLVLLALALVAVPAGRRLGIDQLLAPRLQHAARTSRLARLAFWFV
ncbi:MAG TPA: TQO small subunit DoxD [Ktedonobacteraceae bacterium]|nr:TQO small subunit DoxD [Ktedonobacteraceae bacterium]